MGSNESTFVVVWCLGLPPANAAGNGCWDCCKAVWKLGVEANVPKNDVALEDVSIQSAGADELLICCAEDMSCDWKVDVFVENCEICFDDDIGWSGAAMGKSWATVLDSDEGGEVFCK